MDDRIRVFISFSHEDVQMVEKLVAILKKDGIMVLWSRKLTGGIEYIEELKVFIEHAHIFMPVITESSSARGWVHQEIGYAVGLHIPVLPVLVGNVRPIGMIENIQAIRLGNDNIILNEQLSYNILSALLKREPLPALYQQAARVEERAGLMKNYADKVSAMEKFGIVRQRGGLSSFHIPTERIENQVWIDRYFPEQRSQLHKKMQREERIALEQHAEKEGCRLIINPLYAIEGRSDLAASTRLNTMISFLESMTDGKVVIAIQKGKTNKESLTMVGDWFLAESVSFKDGDGFTNTFFTRNASEINARIKDFDEELSELLTYNKWTETNSREKAIAHLKSLIHEMKL
jgi:hypothetical protein